MKVLWFCLLLFPCWATAAQVIHVVDGDTLIVREGRHRIDIRLANIDAPEKKQPYGERSRQSLASLCYGKEAEVWPESIDKYGRTVAIVSCDGIQVSREQVARGMAWVYMNKSHADHSLPLLQSSARTKHLGLWASKRPMPPWEFRRRRLHESAKNKNDKQWKSRSK